MRAIVSVDLVADDGTALVGAVREEVIVQTADAEQNFLNAAAMIAELLPAVKDSVDRQFADVGAQFAREPRPAPAPPPRHRRR